MQLTQLFDSQRILLNQYASDKIDLYQRMVEAIFKPPFSDENPHLSRDMILASILQREKQGSTALGNGFLYPHARMASCHGVAVVIATLDPPLSVPEAMDKRPVDTVCMMIGPEENPTLFLKVMSCLAQFIGSSRQRQELLAASNARDAYRILSSSKLSMDIPILARDIMRPLRFHIKQDTLLKHVARQMLHHHLEAAPVLDDSRAVVGEITSDLLFQFGLPDFFSQLKSVSFIREFDPFEKYFERESHATAGEVMGRNFATMSADSTLLEVIFQLAVRKKAKVYVTDSGGKCVGVIDRMLVLDRVINI